MSRNDVFKLKERNLIRKLVGVNNLRAMISKEWPRDSNARKTLVLWSGSDTLVI